MTTGRQATPLFTLSLLAAAAVAQHTAVGWDGNQAGAGTAIGGITRDQSIVGQMMAVDLLGTTIAIAGAGITAGQALEVGAAGVLIPHASGIVVARAVEAANNGDEFEVFLLPS